MREACQDFGVDLAEFSGVDDHVDLLVRYPPAVAISRLANLLMGVWSRLLSEENAGRADRAGTRALSWPTSYHARSGGGEPLSDVKDYIANQKRPA